MYFEWWKCVSNFRTFLNFRILIHTKISKQTVQAHNRLKEQSIRPFDVGFSVLKTSN